MRVFATKMAVGPSAAPITAMEAASLRSKKKPARSYNKVWKNLNKKLRKRLMRYTNSEYGEEKSKTCHSRERSCGKLDQKNDIAGGQIYAAFHLKTLGGHILFRAALGKAVVSVHILFHGCFSFPYSLRKTFILPSYCRFRPAGPPGAPGRRDPRRRPSCGPQCGCDPAHR